MRKVTSLTTHVTAEGTRLSMTYSEIDELGNLIKSNERVNRIVVDATVQVYIDALNAHAQSIVDAL
jgi:hypothetical protein